MSRIEANIPSVPEFQFNVASQAVTGALTWNPNGSLAGLSITDPFNSGNAQTCSYSHDDLARIASANCGTPWTQTFSYDPFGNLSKSGTQSFQPNYSQPNQPTKNQYASFNGFTPTYDSNGNVTADPNNTYTWDAYGRPVTMDGVNLTYDALGRMVEQNSGSAYDEIAYTPTGAKLALMNGSTLVKAFVGLPAGAQAVYTASGLAYYRHGDWLGSSRLASTPSQTVYSDTAYAPFGEHYTASGTTDQSFTGQNQDTVTGVYDFPARELGEVSGRWPSPDPLGLGAVNPGDPQTWNRYAYVRNSPLNFTDPTGMILNAAAYIASLVDSSGGGGGGWDEFDLLELAFTPTGYDANVDTSSGCLYYFDCAPTTYTPVYGNIGILSTLGGPGGDLGTLPIASRLGTTTQLSPCQTQSLIPLSDSLNYTLADSNVVPLFAPDFDFALDNAIVLLNDQGIVPQINSGFRAPWANVNSGPRPQASPWHSYHSSGEAVDIQYGQSPTIIDAMSDFGLVWGGSFNDPVHFDNRAQLSSTANNAAIADILPYVLNCTNIPGR